MSLCLTLENLQLTPFLALKKSVLNKEPEGKQFVHLANLINKYDLLKHKGVSTCKLEDEQEFEGTPEEQVDTALLALSHLNYHDEK